MAREPIQQAEAWRAARQGSADCWLVVYFTDGAGLYFVAFVPDGACIVYEPDGLAAAWGSPFYWTRKLPGYYDGRHVLGGAWQYGLLYGRSGAAEYRTCFAARPALIQSIRGIGLFRTAIFVPVMTSLIVWAIVWKLMYATESGLINQLLLMMGIKGPAWLYDPNLAMPAVIVTSVLKNVGLNMVLFIAALQQVPRSLYEAATLDGAGRRASFFNVTLPMITPTVFLTVVMTVIGSLKVFGQIYVMTQGGPSNSTKVLVYYIWEKAFKLFQFGYASSLAYVLFLIVLILTLLQWQLRKKVGVW